MFVAQATRVALPSTRGAPAPGRGARVAHRRAVLPRATNLNATARVVVPAHVHPARPPAFASHASSGGPSGFRANVPFPVVPTRHASAPRSRAGQVNAHTARANDLALDDHAYPPTPPRWTGTLGTVARAVGALLAALFFVSTRPAFAKSASPEMASPVVAAAAAGESTGAVVGTVALLVVYAFFCISETAITTLWPWKVREISDQEGPDSPFTMLRKDITRFLTTILIGSTCTSIGSAALATEAALRMYGEAGVGYATIFLTVVTLILCEIAPKSYAVQHATAVARVCIRPIALLSYVVYPIGRICTGLVNAIFRALGIQGSAEPFVSEEELKLVLSGAAKSGQVDSGEQEMIQNVLEMGETPVREVMTPLVRVVGIEQSCSLDDLQALYREHRYSRVPVYDDRVDNIVGVASSMRMLEYSLEPETLAKISVVELTQGAPFYVPESMSVVKLMRELLARKTHMCIVVNEHGGTIGIATFEDCVEEIVGEIYDESDEPDDIESNSDYIREVAPDVYDVDYRATVDDLAEIAGVEIPSSALYDTVGGFACDCFDRIPAVGETIFVTLQTSNAFDDDVDEDGPIVQPGAEGDPIADRDDDEREYLSTRPVRITVTDGDVKMVRAVQVRVNDAAMLASVDDIESDEANDTEGGGDVEGRRVIEALPSADEYDGEGMTVGESIAVDETRLPSR